MASLAATVVGKWYSRRPHRRVAWGVWAGWSVAAAEVAPRQGGQRQRELIGGVTDTVGASSRCRA